MICHEPLLDLTESYLKSLISEVASLSRDFDSCVPFGDLGIDSFHVLRIIRKLELDFGTLPKSLLFENFTINDLAKYFVSKHEQTVSAKFGERLQATKSVSHTDSQRREALKQATPAGDNQGSDAVGDECIRIL